MSTKLNRIDDIKYRVKLRSEMREREDNQSNLKGEKANWITKIRMKFFFCTVPHGTVNYRSAQCMKQVLSP